jgi:predicted Zn-dependent peptidase
VRFGAHQNAYTSFDVTCYELHVPLDGTDLLERGLQVLRQLVSF